MDDIQMKNTNDMFQVAVIHDELENTYEVEVDGQSIQVFKNKADADGLAELLTFTYDVGYEQKEKEFEQITEEDTHFPFEMPDKFTFINNFAGKGS